MREADPVRATTERVAADHALIATRRREGALATTVLRTRSVYAREILAAAAWPGHTPAELEGWVVDRPLSAGLPPDSDPVKVADYARVLAVQLGDPDERAVAHAMLERVALSDAWPEVRRDRVELLAQLRLLAGDRTGAIGAAQDERVREQVRASIVADTLNPHLDPSADAQAWAAAFSQALHSDRLSPFVVGEGELPDLDRLTVEPRPDVPAPLLVTVMMSCYRPGPALLTAVSSVLAQTWTNLELFVVDDASGPGPDGRWSSLLDRVEAMDPRVRVIRKAVNGGTYRARNTVLRQASGDLAIVIDSDDWWHPQTLEVCAAPLLANPALLATRAEGVRVPPNLVLTRPGYRPRFESAATVLFRRREVTARIGFFDPTRKGADTEFARRLVASFGPVVKDIRETTTVLRSGEESLSAEEFSNGWRHPARHQYKSLYTAWHTEIRRGESDPYLDPELQRGFPEPWRWDRPTHHLVDRSRHVDLCLAGDWRRDGGPQRSMMEEIRAAREAGLRVGIMHLEAMRFMTPQDQHPNARIVDLVRRGEVDWILPDDDADIDILMIRYPPILQYPPRLSRSVRARHVLVVANQGPLEPDGSDQRYVVADVTARTEELFGRPVTWVPQSSNIRTLLLREEPDVRLSSWDSPGLLDVQEWFVRPPGPPGHGGRPVVVGRHSRDDVIKFPPTYDQLLKGYSFPEGYEVRMLGGRNRVSALWRESGTEDPMPANWRLLPHQAGDVRPFLAGLDFVLYLDNPMAHEAFGRSLLEAASSGAVTIAHPKHRPTFGDAIEYAEPGEAQDIIAGYVADPDAYRERVARTHAIIEKRYGHQSFVEHLRPLLDGSDRVGARTPARAPENADARVRTDSSAPVRITFPGSGHAPPTVEGAQSEHVPLRSAADAERGASATVVHQGLGREALRSWLHADLTGATDPRWTPVPLLEHAPDGVVAVVLERDGLVLAAGRGRWDVLAPAEELLDLLGLPRPGPQGWSCLAWFATRPPTALTLSDGSPDRSAPDWRPPYATAPTRQAAAPHRPA